MKEAGRPLAGPSISEPPTCDWLIPPTLSETSTLKSKSALKSLTVHLLSPSCTRVL